MIIHTDRFFGSFVLLIATPFILFCDGFISGFFGSWYPVGAPSIVIFVIAMGGLLYSFEMDVWHHLMRDRI